MGHIGSSILYPTGKGIYKTRIEQTLGKTDIKELLIAIANSDNGIVTILLKALPYKNEIAKNQIYIYWNIYE
jgi:hypothetical protein